MEPSLQIMPELPGTCAGHGHLLPDVAASESDGTSLADHLVEYPSLIPEGVEPSPRELGLLGLAP